MAGTDQAFQISLMGMDRHAAHGDVFAQMLAAFGERNRQGFCRFDGIVKEHLVEIAHPVEEDRVGMGLLDLQILRHHRCRVGGNRRLGGRRIRRNGRGGRGGVFGAIRHGRWSDRT